MLLIIDNYDSFTYNLYQAFATDYSNIKVVRNDQITLEEIEQLKPHGIVLSPGPGRPEQAGICLTLIHRFTESIPILGVCLGHQAIGLAFGAQISSSPEILHGKDSLIFHNQGDLFRGIPQTFKAGRYHSLVIKNLPETLLIDAKTQDGTIMAVRHKHYPVYGVQFHPESILTPHGTKIIQNFLRVCA